MSISSRPKPGQQPTKEAIPESTTAKFSSLPIFQTTMEDPTFRPVSMSRTVTHAGHGHTLMGRTWNTPETIDALISFYRARRGATTSPADHVSTPDASTTAEVRRFYAFGNALNAHPDLLHGGVISCILDSGLGGAVGMSVGRGAAAAQEGEGLDVPMFTVQLNVRYRAPVRTPGVVVVRAWVERMDREGRKVWAKGVVEGAEGLVHAEAEGLWVRGKEAKV